MTATHSHSGDWIIAYPIAQVGNHLDDEDLRIGLNACLAYQCRCGTTVQSDGLHPLLCRFSAGRFSRHDATNNIINRSLDTERLHSILEPVCLDRGDGRQPDGGLEEDLRRWKHSQLVEDFEFVPVAVETSAIIGSAGCSLLTDIGRRISRTTNDNSPDFLHLSTNFEIC